MGSSRFAFDDQAMIAHVTSPFTDKIAPYRSNPPTDLRTLSLSLSLSFSFFLSSSTFASFLLSRHLSPEFDPFETCTRAGTCGDRAASREFNNCRSSRSRVNAMPRARAVVLRTPRYLSHVYVYTGKGLLHLFSGETNDRSFPADWDSENYDAVPRSSLKISSRNLIVRVGGKCRD